MREAVGGSLLFYIIIGFLFIFIVFIALIMNYAAAYRASNYVVTMIERTEGEVQIGSSNSIAGDKTLYGALMERKYYNSLDVSCSENSNGAIYKVITTVPFEVPLIGAKPKITIQNETKTLYKVKCKNNATGHVDPRN